MKVLGETGMDVLVEEIKRIRHSVESNNDKLETVHPTYIEGTYAEIKGLMDTGQLYPGCTYVITDHQLCYQHANILTDDTYQIKLFALTTNTFATDVQWKSSTGDWQNAKYSFVATICGHEVKYLQPEHKGVLWDIEYTISTDSKVVVKKYPYMPDAFSIDVETNPNLVLMTNGECFDKTIGGKYNIHQISDDKYLHIYEFSHPHIKFIHYFFGLISESSTAIEFSPETFKRCLEIEFTNGEHKYVFEETASGEPVTFYMFETINALDSIVTSSNNENRFLDATPDIKCLVFGMENEAYTINDEQYEFMGDVKIADDFSGTTSTLLKKDDQYFCLTEYKNSRGSATTAIMSLSGSNKYFASDANLFAGDVFDIFNLNADFIWSHLMDTYFYIGYCEVASGEPIRVRLTRYKDSWGNVNPPLINELFASTYGQLVLSSTGRLCRRVNDGSYCYHAGEDVTDEILAKLSDENLYRHCDVFIRTMELPTIDFKRSWPFIDSGLYRKQISIHVSSTQQIDTIPGTYFEGQSLPAMYYIVTSDMKPGYFDMPEFSKNVYPCTDLRVFDIGEFNVSSTIFKSPVFSNGKSLMISSVRVVSDYSKDNLPIGVLNCLTNIIIINPANYSAYISNSVFANICEYRSKALGLVNVIVNSNNSLVIEYTDKTTGERVIANEIYYQ